MTIPTNYSVPDTTPLDAVMDKCVALIADGIEYEDYDAYLRQTYGPGKEEFLPWPPILTMARILWRQIPHPRRNFALGEPLKTRRNDPCHCGSGRKYKQCCQEMEAGFPPLEANMLPSLLAHLPKKRWRDLAGSRVPMDMMGDTAQQIFASDPEDACTLLEPWFVQDADFTVKRSELLIILLDAYPAAQHPRKKARLLKQAHQVGDRPVRALAMQGMATHASERGRHDEAWDLFRQAMRTDPDAPSLAHVEIALLLAQDRQQEAKDRAQFWLHRLSALQEPGLEPLLGYLRQISNDGIAGVNRIRARQIPLIKRFQELLDEAPTMQFRYQLDPQDDSAGPLIPDPELAALINLWRRQAPPVGDAMAPRMDITEEELEQWLSVLADAPPLWNAFEPLETLAIGLQILYGEKIVDDTIKPLLVRAEALLCQTLHNHRAGNLKLEWRWRENRPALGLIGERIGLEARQGQAAESMARMEWMVNVLDPEDSLGFRDPLMYAYLESGGVKQALALSDRFPENLPIMQYNRALTLYALGRTKDALNALNAAFEAWPKIPGWLLSSDPKPPEPDPEAEIGPGFGMVIGSDEDAWMYRHNALGLWKKLGAFDWLKQFHQRQKTRKH